MHTFFDIGGRSSHLHREPTAEPTIVCPDGFDEKLSKLFENENLIVLQFVGTDGGIRADAGRQQHALRAEVADEDDIAEHLKSAMRISLALADGESLENAGSRQFAEYSEALAWAQRAVLDR